MQKNKLPAVATVTNETRRRINREFRPGIPET
jgi:hypothetical protein